MMRNIFIAAALLATPAAAQDAPAAPAAPLAFAPVVTSLVDDVIIPAHAAFAEAADGEADLMAALCEAPSPETLDEARAGFLDAVRAFSRIELFRIGPARENNRVERLLFWPDRRSRGLQQIAAVIAEEDESATSLDTLEAKSVAVQGFPALEYVLYGAGSETLAEDADFRCRYGMTVADSIARIAAELEEGWAGDFRQTLVEAGPDNPVYRSHGEALQDLLQAGAEQLELTGALKLGGSIGETEADAKPKLAPFWRSNATLSALVGNLEGVAVLMTDDLAALLGDKAYLTQSTIFELRSAATALMRYDDDPRSFVELAEDPEAHRYLAYAESPIAGAHTILAEQIPTALGLISGFNAMDGD